MIGILLLFFTKLVASDYSGFYNVAGKDNIRAFSKDLSALTSSSIFYSARTLGFGGFSLNYKRGYLLKPSANDTVFKKDNTVDISFVQIETGLPYRLDTFLRAGGDDGYNLIGGGIRYGLKAITDEKYRVNLSFSAHTHMGLYKDFYLLSFGSRIAVSMRISDVVIPFMGGGFDSFKFNVKSHSDPSLVGYSIYDKTYLASCGVRFKISWFNLAASYERYNTGVDLVSITSGVRF